MRGFFLPAIVALMTAGCTAQPEEEFTYENMMQSLHAGVINDAVQQYQIANRQGDHVQICAQAGLVTAAYLQANDETNYRKWKVTEKADCDRSERIMMSELGL